METGFAFSQGQFSKLFPFYLLINRKKQIISFGKSVAKLCDFGNDKIFENYFAIPRPLTQVETLDDLIGLQNQMVILESLEPYNFRLRGQFEYLADKDEVLFVGSPWFGSMDQVTGTGLTIHDFALHDPMIDLLHVLKTQEITNEDLRQLLTTVNKQKRELQQAKKQLEEMALFPMQNPDALVRIGNDGTVLLMNPSATHLKEFLYDGKTYTVDEFWKMIAEQVRPDADVWQFEAASGGRIFSFLCKNIAGFGYFNVYGRDITEKQATEKSLLQSEQNFRIMGENIPGLIYLWRLNYDGSSYFEYMSPRLEAELGLPMEDLEKLATYIHPEDLGDWGAKVQQAFVNNKPFEYNGRLLLPDNKVVWIQAASRIAYEDEQGKVFSGFFRNVTQERSHRAEFERLSLVASANENGVLFTDATGRITWANEGFEKLSGYNPDEIMGKTPIELCRGPLTDYDTMKVVVNAFFAGQSFQADIIYYRKDGSSFWGRSTTQPVKNEKGEVTGFFGIVEDITKDKEQADQLKLLSKIAEDNVNAVIVADAEGKIEWVNKSFETMTGYSLDEVSGRKPGQFLQGPNTDTATREYLAMKIAAGESFECEILNYTKQGNEYWLRIHGQALKDDRGVITKFFAIEEDITRQREAAEKLKETEARYRMAIEKMGDNVWEHNFLTGETHFSANEGALLGYTKDEFESNVNMWWNCVVEEDRHLLKESDEGYRKGRQVKHSMEYRMRDKNGQIIWILDRGVVVENNRQGNPLRILGTHTNVTRIKQTEVALEQRLKQFKSLSENIPGVIYEYEFRPDGTEGLRYVSPAIEEVFGIPPAEFVNYTRYLHPDDLPRVIEKNKLSRQHQTPFYDESRIQLPDGRQLWHSVSSSFSYNTEDGTAVFTGFMQDITARKQVEVELERQRKFYGDILNNMPADIAVFSPNHEYLYVNPRGIKDEALRKWIIGKRDEDYCAFRNKPQSIAASRRAIFNKVAESRLPDEWEEKIDKPEGKVEWVLRRWYPVIDKDGNLQLVIGYGVDITRRKLAEEALRFNEEKYRSIIANMNLGIMEINTLGIITYTNQSFVKMTGIAPEKLAGMEAKILLSPEDRVKNANRLEDRRKGKSEAYEMMPQLPGQKKAWWLVSAAPKFDSAGEFEGVIIICLDITEQKQMQTDLEAAKKQAEQLAKAKETFLANMSHEIRTPMNAIIGLGRQLKRTKLDEQQTHFLDSINTASENLLVIINDILDLSKIEAGKMSLEHLGFRPKELLHQAVSLLGHRAEEKGLWIVHDVDESVSPVLLGDPYRLNQVLMNLISNSVKFTSKGGISVSLKLLENSVTSQKLAISVTDTGVGMSEEFLLNIFQPFTQDKKNQSHSFGGTGLGLAITKHLVELMGGSLEVTSTQGLGTVFTISLTFETGSESDLPREQEFTESPDLLNGLRILLVEDNIMNRLVASTILSQCGAVITEAANGAIAIDLLQQSNFDVVLMDMQMPVMDGLTATRKIRSDISETLPIIALTANALDSEKKQCLEAGMNDFVSKPFEENLLLQTIAKWTGRHEVKAAVPLPPEPIIINQPLYNLKSLHEISRGNVEFVKKMVHLFINQTPSAILSMEESFLANDFDSVSKIAHRIKPSLDNMGISTLKEDIREIELNAREYGPSERLHNLIVQVKKVIGQVVVELRVAFGDD